MLYQVDEECLSEYISYKRIELGDGVVEHLYDLKSVVDDDNTKQFLQNYVNKFSREFKVCKSCFGELLPIVIREPHKELDGDFYENVVVGYSCQGCGSRYDY